jgi:exodeoxyribonuclease X
MKKVKFGKYKGLSFEEIVKIDRDYIVWLSNNTKDSVLYIKLRNLLK